jgi:hypothetical protein
VSISRNDPCPCGSGKKYKKCCLTKKNVIEFKEVKEERFYQQKHNLVEKLRGFIEANIPFQQYYELKHEFLKRTEHSLSANNREGFFQFWLYFCRRFENNLRGIEWFFHEQASKLPLEEKTMAKTWTGLTFKIVEAVNKKDEIVLFEDVLTKEQFPVQDLENNISKFIPWYGTIGLLESFEEKYYFNGVRMFEGPVNIKRAANLVRELTKQKNVSPGQILFDYYPEILSAFAGENKGSSNEEKEIQEYILEYKILNQVNLENLLHGQKDFIDEGHDDRKIFSWLGNWKVYKDSELKEEILTADDFASIKVENDTLLFRSVMGEKTEEFMVIMKKTPNAVQFVSEKTKSYKVPLDFEIKNKYIHMSKDVPRYFTLFASTDLFSDVSMPMEIFDDQSIRQLVGNGKANDAVNWLKLKEFNLYQQALKENKTVEITADFNSVRRELGLPLSPFVTGGEDRYSSVKSIGNPFVETIIEEKDIPFYEAVGFTPDTIHNFYSKDLVEFFKVKTIGKKDATVRKYLTSLYLIREELESLALQSWVDCNDTFWVRLIEKEVFSAEVSKTFQRDFLSTIKAFTKWIDSKEQTSISKSVFLRIKETGNELVNT